MNYEKTPEQVHEFYREVERHVAAIPGVEKVALGFSVPWRDNREQGINLAFAAQGSRRSERPGLPRSLPLRWAGILLHPRHAPH